MTCDHQHLIEGEEKDSGEPAGLWSCAACDLKFYPATELDRLTRELDEARKENESLAFRIKASASAALGFMDQRDQLERQLAEAKKENERLRMWVFGPLPAAPNEAGKP